MYAVLENGGTIVFQNSDPEICEAKCDALNEHMRPDFKYYSVVGLVVIVPEPRGEIPAVDLEPYYVTREGEQTYHMPHGKEIRLGNYSYSLVRTEKEAPVLVALPTVIASVQIPVDRTTAEMFGLIRVQGDLFRIEEPKIKRLNYPPILVPAGS